MNKIKKSLLDDCREHLVFAIGSAAGAGEHETAARINAILVDLDIECEMCYTGKNARKARENEEEKKMRKLRIYVKTPFSFAVEVDGKEVYATGKAKDIARYCEKHFGVKLPTETKNYPTGTKTYFDGMPKTGFEFDIE